jgi:hypothetical protein
MYKLIKIYKNEIGENRIEFITPSGKTKNYRITAMEKIKLESIKDDPLLVDNFLYGIA